MLRRLSNSDMKDVVKRMKGSIHMENEIVGHILDVPKMLSYRHTVSDSLLKLDVSSIEDKFIKRSAENHLKINKDNPYIYPSWNNDLLVEYNNNELFTINEHMEMLFNGNHVTPLSNGYVYSKDSDRIINLNTTTGKPKVITDKVNSMKVSNMVDKETLDILSDSLKYFNKNIVDIRNVEILSMSLSNNIHLGDLRGSIDSKYKKINNAVGGRALVDANTIFLNKNVFSTMCFLKLNKWTGGFSKHVLGIMNILAHESQHIVQFKMGRLKLYSKQKDITQYIGVGVPNSRKISDFTNYVQALNETEAFLFGTWFILTKSGFDRSKMKKTDFKIMEYLDRSIFLKLMKSIYKSDEVKRKISIFDEVSKIVDGLE